MILPSWEPLGRALEAYWAGDVTAALEVHLEGGRRSALPAAELFRQDGFPAAEVAALELARGRVLDAGAGAGSHALELQEDGLEVMALDLSPRAVEVMRQRGVEHAECGDLATLEGESFDTVLLMMNGLGLAGDLAGLDRLLVHAHGLLRPGGMLLFDGCDLRQTDDEIEQRLIAERRAAGRYFGAVMFQMGWRGELGEPFAWLFVDPATLRYRARRAGWQMQMIYQEPGGAYTARLVARW